MTQRGHARQQIELLEHEADRPVSQRRELVAGKLGDIPPVDADLPGGRHVERPHQVHQGRLARPRGAHHGDVLALQDLERDRIERPHRLAAERVGLVHVPSRDHRRREACAGRGGLWRPSHWVAGWRERTTALSPSFRVSPRTSAKRSSIRPRSTCRLFIAPSAFRNPYGHAAPAAPAVGALALGLPRLQGRPLSVAGDGGDS